MFRICGKLDDAFAEPDITTYIRELQTEHCHKFNSNEE